MVPPLALSDEFSKLLGIFHYNWTATDIHIDYAIYQFLKVTPLQAHLITSGLVSGRKIRLLVDLIKHSDDPNKNLLLSVLGGISKAKRELITHGWIRSDATSVTFLERRISGPFSAEEHNYSLVDFEKLVWDVQKAGNEFRRLIGATSIQLDEFANTALRASRKAPKSAGKPASS